MPELTVYKQFTIPDIQIKDWVALLVWYLLKSVEDKGRAHVEQKIDGKPRGKEDRLNLIATVLQENSLPSAFPWWPQDFPVGPPPKHPNWI